MSHLTSITQWYDEFVANYIRRFGKIKNWCYGVNISERYLVEWALNGLQSYIKERLEGSEYMNINKVWQRALPQESGAKIQS